MSKQLIALLITAFTSGITMAEPASQSDIESIEFKSIRCSTKNCSVIVSTLFNEDAHKRLVYKQLPQLIQDGFTPVRSACELSVTLTPSQVILLMSGSFPNEEISDGITATKEMIIRTALEYHNEKGCGLFAREQ